MAYVLFCLWFISESCVNKCVIWVINVLNDNETYFASLQFNLMSDCLSDDRYIGAMFVLIIIPVVDLLFPISCSI